jgi:F-type H+-transporting ATPase subunit gamma
MARSLCKAFRKGEFDEIRLGYSTFVSVLSQTPTTMRLLPIERETSEKQASAQEILYEPNSVEVFENIIPEYIGGVIYGALCESRASEQAARRSAMDTATQNAEEMIADLNLKFNQARQAAITQEITEIVAGT